MDLVNIHCHALWGVDDGAKDRDESCAMLSAMYTSGVRAVCLTPHFDPAGGIATDADEIRRRFDELCSGVAHVLPDMKLYLGEEIFSHVDAVNNLTDGVCLTLNGSRAVLLEFGPFEDASEIISGASKLLTSGYIPVIAHIERYRSLVKSRREILRLHEAGALIQINASTVLGKRGFLMRHFADRLISDGIADVIADDSHNMDDRAPCLAEAAQYVSRKFGNDVCERMFLRTPFEILSM